MYVLILDACSTKQSPHYQSYNVPDRWQETDDSTATTERMIEILIDEWH